MAQTPINIDHLLKKPDELPEGKANFALTCKDDSDHVLRKGEAGFDDCVTKAQARMVNEVNKPHEREDPAGTQKSR